jgi:hypothetical protein
MMTDIANPKFPARGYGSAVDEYFDENGEWRLTLTSGTKFNNKARSVYLRELSAHGRRTSAMISAGISHSTLRYAEKDPEFLEASAHAISMYKDRLIAHHQDLVFNGIPKTRYDSRGNIVEESVDYPIRLIELELKKHDDGYRDKREVNMNISGGVLVAPAGLTIDEWEKKHGVTVEGKFTEAEIKTDDDSPVPIAEE